MKKRIWIVAIAIVLVIAVCFAVWLTPRQDGSKGILYRVTGEEGSAYLLGSIHIGTPEMYPFGDTLQEAMASADTFVFESDTTSNDTIQQLMARMPLPTGVSLCSILGDELMDEVVETYQKLNLNPATIDIQQPWVVISTLAVYSSAIEMGIENMQKAISLGVETAVRDYAASHNKPFAYLETMDEFADTMESFSNGLIRYLIQDEVTWILHRDSIPEMSALEQWPALWRAGDAENFWASYQQSIVNADVELYQEYEDKLIAQRNILMAERLDAMFKNGGTYFVTVGLLHLIYENDNILLLLREKGYTVEQVVQE